MNSKTGLMIVLLCCVLWIASTLGQRSRCDTCGRECLSACGTPHFKTCCYNYLRKRNGGEAPHAAAVATLEPNSDAYLSLSSNSNSNTNTDNSELSNLEAGNRHGGGGGNSINSNDGGLSDGNSLDFDNAYRYNEEFVFAKIVRDPRTGHLELFYTK